MLWTDVCRNVCTVLYKRTAKGSTKETGLCYESTVAMAIKATVMWTLTLPYMMDQQNSKLTGDIVSPRPWGHLEVPYVSMYEVYVTFYLRLRRPLTNFICDSFLLFRSSNPLLRRGQSKNNKNLAFPCVPPCCPHTIMSSSSETRSHFKITAA
jgi:hypothetical protein